MTRIERVEEESQETRLENKEKSKGDGGGREGACGAVRGDGACCSKRGGAVEAWE